MNTLIKHINKKVVLDNKNKPIEVIINYKLWTAIENILKVHKKVMTKNKLQKYVNTIKLKENPVKFQQRMRYEWQ